MERLDDSIFHIQYLLTEPITTQEEKELLAELDILKKMKEEKRLWPNRYSIYYQ